jgi:hypothetical protein
MTELCDGCGRQRDGIEEFRGGFYCPDCAAEIEYERSPLDVGEAPLGALVDADAAETRKQPTMSAPAPRAAHVARLRGRRYDL